MRVIPAAVILGLLACAPGAHADVGASTRGAASAQPAVDDQSRAAYEHASAYSAKFGGRAVLVMRGGKIEHEWYGNGWTANRPHPLASGTKSFTGVVAAAAVQDGLISWDALANERITEWKSDPRKSRITVRHLLTLSSGLDPADATLASRGGGRLLGEAAADRARRLDAQGKPRARNFFKAAVNVEAKHEPGERFEYGSSHFYAFGELLQRAIKARHETDKSFPYTFFDAYLRGRVLEPIGIDLRIGRDADGNPNLPGGAMLTARDWARFGQFVLQRGAWPTEDGQKRDIVAWDHLKECFKPSATNPAYGLTWWLRTDAEATLVADAGGRANQERTLSQLRGVRGPGEENLEVYMAAGLGKQRLYVIPAHDLVVVRFAEATREGRRFDDGKFLRPIVTRSVPQGKARE